MLTNFTLSGFRSWNARTSLELAPLTVLAGANNTGKSSMIGALLALLQSEQATSGERVLLSGDWIELGHYPEVLSPGADGFSIGIAGTRDGRVLDVVWDFHAAENRDQAVAKLARVEVAIDDDVFALVPDVDAVRLVREGGSSEIVSMPHPGAFRPISGALRPLVPFGYAHVFNVGPWRAPSERLSPYRHGGNGPAVGKYGGNAAQLFFEHSHLEADVLPSGEHASGLWHAVDAWWRHILGVDVTVRVEEVRRAGFTVKVDAPGAEGLSFSQVGFGLSQLWPILVASLVSRPGDLVIIETPEAHLHPAAQHRVAALFVELAKRGRQVIVETHSEHLVMAMSLAIKEGALPADDVAVHFFAQQEGQTLIERIPIDASGRRLKAPEGFFDQAAIDLLRLMQP